MKTKRHTTEEIIRILCKADGQQTVDEVCGITISANRPSTDDGHPHLKHNWVKPPDLSVVEVTRTDPLGKLAWTNKKDPENERNKILNRTEDSHPA